MSLDYFRQKLLKHSSYYPKLVMALNRGFKLKR